MSDPRNEALIRSMPFHHTHRLDPEVICYTVEQLHALLDAARAQRGPSGDE